MVAGPITYSDEQLALRPRLEAANIDPNSFLATDYLNHFNEILMSLDMVLDMPDFVEDLKDWEPLSYAEHFRLSSFAAKALVIEAYDAAPEDVRTDFDMTADALNGMIGDVIQDLVAALEEGSPLDPRFVQNFEQERSAMNDMLSHLNGLIHCGTDAATDADEQAADADRQSEIDQLFD